MIWQKVIPSLNNPLLNPVVAIWVAQATIAPALRRAPAFARQAQGFSTTRLGALVTSNYPSCLNHYSDY